MSKSTRGFSLSAKSVLIPVFIIIFILLSCATLIVFKIRSVESGIMEANDAFADCSDYSRMLQKGSDVLSDEVRLFAAEGNYKNIFNYFREANVDRNRDKAVALLRESDVEGKASGYLDKAMEYSVALMDLEYHAMKLRASASGLDVSEFPEVRDYALSDEENALSDIEKIDLALSTVDGTEYFELKTNIRDNVDLAINALIEATHARYQQFNAELGHYMDLLWIVIISIILVLALLFAAILIFLVIPLKMCVGNLDEDTEIAFKGGFSEFRHLSRSYNKLLKRHRELEAELRNNAQTDVLTGLPNRLALNYYIASLNSAANMESSVVIVSFDVNDLKLINDSRGHASGDELLRSASECIINTFGVGNGSNCFRFGGDEFAAFLSGVTQEEVDSMVKKFKLSQVRYGVSIAVGYSYAEKISATTADDLFYQADLNMYADKAACKGITLEELRRGR